MFPLLRLFLPLREKQVISCKNQRLLFLLPLLFLLLPPLLFQSSSPSKQLYVQLWCYDEYSYRQKFFKEAREGNVKNLEGLLQIAPMLKNHIERAFCYTCQWGQLLAAQFLFSKGVNLRATQDPVLPAISMQFIPLFYVIRGDDGPLDKLQGRLSILKWLLEVDPHMLRDSKDKTKLLEYATKYIDILRFLLKAHEWQRKEKVEALKYTRYNKWNESIHELEESLKQPSTTSSSTYTSLIEAAKKNDTNEVKRLLDEGADINEPDGHGMTAMIWACCCGSNKVFEQLLAEGANVNMQDKYGRNALMCACTSGCDGVVIKQLLDKTTNVNMQDNKDRTEPR